MKQNKSKIPKIKGTKNITKEEHKAKKKKRKIYSNINKIIKIEQSFKRQSHKWNLAGRFSLVPIKCMLVGLNNLHGLPPTLIYHVNHGSPCF